MIEFYLFSWKARMLITVLLGLSVFIQTLAIVLKYFSDKLNRVSFFENLCEVFVLGEILVFSLLHGQVVSGYKSGFVVASGYRNIRLFVFLIILVLSVFTSLRSKKILPLSLIPFAGISLPLSENILGAFYPWLFIASLVFFLVRSIIVCLSSASLIKTKISALSVIHAIDILDTGILFSEESGRILLANQKMQDIMVKITGRYFRNAHDFYKAVISSPFNEKYEKIELDGQIVFVLPEGTAWMLIKTDILIGFKKYIHISLTDVTKLWIMTSKLQLQDQELKEKSIEIKETMANLHILSKKKEIENARIRAHDILGQRLSVLLRIIQNKDEIDYDLLESLSKGLLGELKTGKNEIRPYEELESIQQIFGAIGVEVIFEGEFPKDAQKARLFFDIIREGSTNAVRHGLATEINIKSEILEDRYKLMIKNNGYSTEDPLVLGSGIRGIRKKVEDQGGQLEIIQKPLFTLSVLVPGGD